MPPLPAHASRMRSPGAAPHSSATTCAPASAIANRPVAPGAGRRGRIQPARSSASGAIADGGQRGARPLGGEPAGQLVAGDAPGVRAHRDRRRRPRCWRRTRRASRRPAARPATARPASRACRAPPPDRPAGISGGVGQRRLARAAPAGAAARSRSPATPRPPAACTPRPRRRPPRTPARGRGTGSGTRRCAARWHARLEPVQPARRERARSARSSAPRRRSTPYTSSVASARSSAASAGRAIQRRRQGPVGVRAARLDALEHGAGKRTRRGVRRSAPGGVGGGRRSARGSGGLARPREDRAGRRSIAGEHGAAAAPAPRELESPNAIAPPAQATARPSGRRPSTSPGRRRATSPTPARDDARSEQLQRLAFQRRGGARPRIDAARVRRTPARAGDRRQGRPSAFLSSGASVAAA